MAKYWTLRRHWHLFALVAVIAFLGMLTPAQAQDESDAAALLTSSAEAMIELDSFHFLMSTPVGKTLLSDGIELKQVEGDVLRPMSFRATFTVDLGIASIDLQAIGIDTDIWVANPLEGGAFTNLTEGMGGQLPPLALLNPDQLIIQAVNLIQEPVIEGTEDIDGVETTVVSGFFDPSSVAVGGTPVAESFTGDIEPLGVMLWIDGESRVVRADFSGALLPSEQGGGRIVRRVDLSAFNEPLQIERPETSVAN